MSHRLVCTCLFVAAITYAGCARATSTATSVDATADARPIAVALGSVFAVTSDFDLGPALPPGIETTLDELIAATDGPDDPARFLVDQMIAALPPGTARDAAGELEPIVTAYISDQLAAVAPRFAGGVRAIALGLGRIARQFSTLETLDLSTPNDGVRRIVGLRYTLGAKPVDVRLADHGLADIVTDIGFGFSASPLVQLTIAPHVVALPYGTLLRLGLDAAVVPNADPGAVDLDSALRDLVDCTTLGALVADKLGVGSPSLYAVACDAGMTAVATELDDRLAALDASPLELASSGVALGADRDGDGTLDQLSDGVWSGTVSYAGTSTPIADATFTGATAMPTPPTQ